MLAALQRHHGDSFCVSVHHVHCITQRPCATLPKKSAEQNANRRVCIACEYLIVRLGFNYTDQNSKSACRLSCLKSFNLDISLAYDVYLRYDIALVFRGCVFTLLLLLSIPPKF
jgi:hypothetical protein